MGLVTIVLGIGMAGVVAYIGLLTLTSTVFYAYETRAALRSPTDIEAVDSGLTKVRGTVAEHETTMDPAVADSPTVVSSITRSVRDDVTGTLSNYTDERRVDRLVPFRVEDETGEILVEPTNELEDEALEAVERSETAEFDAGEPVPDPIEDAFRTVEDSRAEQVIEELGDADIADDVEDATSSDTSESPEKVETDGGTSSPTVAQRFEERYVSPGDEVWVVGDVETNDAGERRLTNSGLLFRVLTDERNGAVFGYLGYTLLFALITLFLAILMKNLIVGLIPRMLALV